MPTVISQFRGTVGDVLTVGDAVVAGDQLCRIDALGIRESVSSPCDGTITKVHVANGATVGENAPLFEISPAPPPAANA